jgi:membrane protease YdiL (CAAX protease family)
MKFVEQSESISQEPSKRSASRRVLYETVVLLVLTFAAQFLPQGLRMIFTSAPLVYFLIEHYFRHRTWTEAGFNFRAIPRAIAANWFLILLVSVLIQFAVTWAAKSWMPAFIDHVIARLPFTIGHTVDYLPMLLASTLIGALFEEISFRALFQERLSWFLPTPAAIGIVSVIFGIGHWASGDPVIVFIDVLLVILDSIFYGIVFARSKNIYVVWVTHCLANLFAFGFVLLLP